MDQDIGVLLKATRLRCLAVERIVDSSMQRAAVGQQLAERTREAILRSHRVLAKHGMRDLYDMAPGKALVATRACPD
jgi:hypothetical protein